MAIQQQAMSGIQDFVAHTKAAFTPSLHSNDAVIKVGNGNMFTGLQQGFIGARKGGDYEGKALNSFKAAHKKDGNLEGDWDYGKIAGSAITAGIGYRVATGGGVYRDQNGQTNIAGVPFI